jgi:hypothetical protein
MTLNKISQARRLATLYSDLPNYLGNSDPLSERLHIATSPLGKRPADEGPNLLVSHVILTDKELTNIFKRQYCIHIQDQTAEDKSIIILQNITDHLPKDTASLTSLKALSPILQSVEWVVAFHLELLRAIPFIAV